MARFLLIHGSCHGAWCWRDMIPALDALGHQAVAIDLPSHGDNPSKPETVTLDDYRDAVLAHSTPETILVGHSMGGFPIASAANHAPEKMRGLIFLCAYAPLSGVTMADMRRMAPRQPIMHAVLISEDRKTFSIDLKEAPKIFYQDCPKNLVEYALPRLCPQPIQPTETAIDLTLRYAEVPKAYIQCTKDQTIPPEFQSEMSRAFADDRVFEMDTGHSPFFADPEGLAALLDQIAEEL